MNEKKAVPIQLFRALERSLAKHPRFIITDSEGEPYLERVTLGRASEVEGCAKTYLHIIYQSDADRDHHNHPWEFTTKLVYGSYVNHRFDHRTGLHWDQVISTGDSYSMGLEDYHRVTLTSEVVVSIVTRGEKKQDWGFWVPHRGHVGHETYLDEKFGEGNWGGEYE